MESIVFHQGDGSPVRFYVLKQTVFEGTSYLLVTDRENGDGDAYILRDLSSSQDPEAVYEMVEDENEQQAIGSLFQELLKEDDIGLDL